MKRIYPHPDPTYKDVLEVYSQPRHDAATLFVVVRIVGTNIECSSTGSKHHEDNLVDKATLGLIKKFQIASDKMSKLTAR